MPILTKDDFYTINCKGLTTFYGLASLHHYVIHGERINDLAKLWGGKHYNKQNFCRLIDALSKKMDEYKIHLRKVKDDFENTDEQQRFARDFFKSETYRHTLLNQIADCESYIEKFPQYKDSFQSSIQTLRSDILRSEDNFHREGLETDISQKLELDPDYYYKVICPVPDNLYPTLELTNEDIDLLIFSIHFVFRNFPLVVQSNDSPEVMEYIQQTNHYSGRIKQLIEPSYEDNYFDEDEYDLNDLMLLTFNLSALQDIQESNKA